ncbi:MAG: tRNA dimethylallyltransferase [Melioribacteraceae bacterium]|nr:MAG: tRNA dimethylallyltransferase [Melioribacteraceae bacterium]
MERKVIIICGPTASGKTAISLNLAKKLETEIISADSRQLYKHLDIGTAKPDKGELEEVKHHLINNLMPEEDYSASKFEKDAERIIDSLHRAGKIPVVVGGTGLYIEALMRGLIDAPGEDEEYRELIKSYRELYGNEYVYNMLAKSDPVSAAKMLPQNWKRVMRALEVFYVTGEPIWKHHEKEIAEKRYRFFMYAPQWERSKLYKIIETRVDQMINDGLVEEVKSVLDKGYSSGLNSLNTVGYKEIIMYLNNEISLERAIELIKRNTRRYAKRQITWFKRYENLQWKNINSAEDVKKIAGEIKLDILNSL